MHQYIDVWISSPKPTASPVVVSYKCIKLYISANIQPIQMNEHSFCTIWNAQDCGIVINALVCKVMTLLFHVHINTRLYIFRNKRTYCYVLFSKRQRNTSFKFLLTLSDSHENYLSIQIYKCMIIKNLKVPYAPIYRRLISKPKTCLLFFSSKRYIAVRYKCIKLYISATIQPIQMNENSFCTIWNAPDCSIVINAIVCKVMTLLFHMHINTRLYIFGNKRAYCYILFSKRQRNLTFKILLTPNDSHDNYQ